MTSFEPYPVLVDDRHERDRHRQQLSYHCYNAVKRAVRRRVKDVVTPDGVHSGLFGTLHRILDSSSHQPLQLHIVPVCLTKLPSQIERT
jgi:hypothetical protein